MQCLPVWVSLDGWVSLEALTIYDQIDFINSQCEIKTWKTTRSQALLWIDLCSCYIYCISGDGELLVNLPFFLCGIVLNDDGTLISTILETFSIIEIATCSLF
jgi:hypothetical protein